ncbi:hypothetical protein IEQ34_004099 [Dendrobium chrysotoxum]|uniref:Uncharacterized protein n=1 Tax=Dendrobium chrysotoxum TaxID=161865 RepID=A0AAV7HCX2_DENCH|nr:hypothetical protein IEQ34_004099 [Dendrobium chrysotoxum]
MKNSIRNAGGRNPGIAGDKAANGELSSLGSAGDNVVSGPLDPARSAGSGPGVHVLAVVERGEGEIAAPREPAGGIDKAPYVSLQDNRSRVLLPRATEVTLDGALDSGKVGGSGDDGVVDGDSGVLVGISPSLSGDGVLLAAKGLAGVDIAVLEDHGGVAEDEIDSAVDVAVAVELALAVDVEGVLVSLKAAAVEDGEVGA